MIKSLDIRVARALLTGLLSPQGAPETCALYAQSLGVPWLRQQGLAALTWWALRTLPPQHIPAMLAYELRSAYLAAVGDAALHEQELQQVLRALAAQDVRPVVLKGAALAYTVYPDPACRLMGDLDLWVTADEMPRAQAMLERLGYIQRIKPDRPLAFMKRASGEVQLIGSQPGSGAVELHWGAFPGEWLRRTARVDEVAIRARAMAVTLAGQPALALSSEDAILQVAVHLAINHQMAYPWLRGLVDVALLVRRYPVDWAQVAYRAREWRVCTASWLVLKSAATLAGLSEAASVLDQLVPPPLCRWLLSFLVNEQSLVEARDLRTGPLRFIYLLLMVDRVRDAVRLFGRALWPERDWLEARYGRSGTVAQLRHLAGAMRGDV